jgi:hypothetical protein
MEAAATIPQVWMLRKTKASWGFLATYLLLLGLYRGLYLINWVWRYRSDGHLDPIAILPAILHVVLCTAGFVIGMRTKQTTERMRAVDLESIQDKIHPLMKIEKRGEKDEEEKFGFGDDNDIAN